jgi:hypothetical protein
MKWCPSIGVVSGCQAVPDPIRLMPTPIESSIIDPLACPSCSDASSARADAIVRDPRRMASADQTARSFHPARRGKRSFALLVPTPKGRRTLASLADGLVLGKYPRQASRLRLE